MTSGNHHTDRTHGGAAVYHRRQSPTQSAEMAALQESSGEIWGTYDRVMGGRSPFLSVDAYVGPLPDGTKGIEFTTVVPADKNTPPRVARWTGPRDGVIVEGDYAKIKVTVTRNTQDGTA
jgi:hypothetical protein